MTDLSQIKHSHNIVDIIGQYVPLKKQGKEFVGLCPFHGEKTPSFTVNEQKQFYHCFGCGVSGDCIDFIMNFGGLSFVEAAKQLGADTSKNSNDYTIKTPPKPRLISRYRFPKDHRQAPEKAQEFIDNNEPEIINGLVIYRREYLAVMNAYGELLNIAKLGNEIKFLAGGVSYSGFTKIIKNESDKFLVVVNPYDAIKISAMKNINVIIAYTDENMRHICDFSHGDNKVIPVITANDDDFLCYIDKWVKFDGEKLEKMECMN